MPEQSIDTYPVWIEIDTKAIRHNCAEVKRITGGKEILAIVKSNAYGHGSVGVCRVMAEEGINFFGVANVAEAIELRKNGISQDIINLGVFAPGEAESIISNDIVQAIFSFPSILALDKAAKRIGKHARVHIKVDTGLGRLGLRPNEYEIFFGSLKNYGNIKIEGIFSVLTENPEIDKVQLNRLKEAVDLLRNHNITSGHVHLVSSAGTIDFPEAHFGMVRPGIMMLGIYPNDKSRKEIKVELKPVLSLKSRVARVAQMKKSETLSYHGRYVLQDDSFIATIPVGHTHGYPQSASGKAQVLIKGRRYPIIADLPATAMFIDFGNESDISEGDEVVLIGGQGEEMISVYELSEAAGISTYRATAALTPVIPRLFK